MNFRKKIISELNRVKTGKILKERELRIYTLDWDDNILEMPTTIKMDKKVGGSWKPVEVSTEEFAKVRTSPDYRPRNNDFKQAFIDFTLPDTFLRDTEKAIKSNKTSPSFNKFKENLIYANPFSIITARGHDPQVIKKGVRLFIDIVLTPQEKMEMIKNIKSVFEYEKIYSQSFLDKMEDLSAEQIIDLYLDEKGDYYPVSSAEFGKRIGLDVTGGASNPEHSKKMALANFIEKVFYNVGKLIESGQYTKVSLGFSDDDVRNVRAMIEFIEDELSKMYPEIHFVIYDASEGGKRKLVIEKG